MTTRKHFPTVSVSLSDMNTRRRLFGADRRLSVRILVAAALVTAAVEATAAVVAPGDWGFWQVVAPTYAWTVYVNFGRFLPLVCAPAAVAYRNDGWLVCVGVGVFATHAVFPWSVFASPWSPTPAELLVGVALNTAVPSLAAGTLGYLLGVAARYLVRARGWVGTPG